MNTATREAADTTNAAQSASNTMPLVIVTILFFMWGLLTSLNDVLIPHLKAVYTLSYVQAMLVQFCFFSAYFVVSVPAGMLVRRIGYQNGAVAGLVIAATGCAMFFPAASGGYAVFLLAFFVLAGGITVLQVAANPYVTVLGDPKTASSRLTLTQAFNSLGTTVGPALGGMLIFSVAAVSAADIAKMSVAELSAHRAAEAAAVQVPYLGLAAALLGLAVFFALAKLPRIVDAQLESGSLAGDAAPLMSQKHLVLGAIGIFVYVGGEVSIGSFLINFFGESHIGALKPAEAAKYVSFYWGGAMVGRFIGFAVMRKVSPGATLAFNAGMAIVLIVIAATTSGMLAMWSIIAVGLCNSIMFPTIFSMALNKLGSQTSRGSGVLCMAIVGGALVPFAQGWLADTVGLQASFFLPAACYAFILFYGAKFADMYRTDLPG